MDNLILKRQTTIKTLFKSTSKKGVQIQLSRHTSASHFQSAKERVCHMKSEGFKLPNGETLFISEIEHEIEQGILNLIKNKGVNPDEVYFESLAIISND
jgi:hypothetical protein